MSTFKRYVVFLSAYVCGGGVTRTGAGRSRATANHKPTNVWNPDRTKQCGTFWRTRGVNPKTTMWVKKPRGFVWARRLSGGSEQRVNLKQFGYPSTQWALCKYCPLRIHFISLMISRSDLTAGKWRRECNDNTVGGALTRFIIPAPLGLVKKLCLFVFNYTVSSNTIIIPARTWIYIIANAYYTFFFFCKENQGRM